MTKSKRSRPAPPTRGAKSGAGQRPPSGPPPPASPTPPPGSGQAPPPTAATPAPVAAAPKPAGKPRRAASARSRRGRRELIWLLPAVLLGILVYANTLRGEFVYDDQRQIVRNTLIQDSTLIGQALTSDVWAFKGGEQASSNYWRPAFVAWLILNYRLFGLDSLGWHLTNILLHAAVIALLFALLRRLDLSGPVAGAIALIFAVHPAHTESVAWISGSPDLLLALALLGSTWFVLSLGERATPLRWALALGLYLIALGAKEVAVLYPLIVVALLWRRKRDVEPGGLPLATAATIAAPFAAAAAVYFVLRQAVLGGVAQWPEGSAGYLGTLLTAPAVFALYLRQLVFPYWIGPSYPLRAVTPGSIGLVNVLLPLAIASVAVAWMVWMALRSRIARIGLALFLVPLVPAMNIAAFHPEQLIHDRYLYLPLLGFLILVVPPLAALLDRALGGARAREPWPVYGVAAALCLPLILQTVRYNRAWLSDLALWEWGVRSDPGSAFNQQQYGVVLHEAKRLDEAIAALDRSIEINPQANAYLARGTTEIDRRNFAAAERDLRAVSSKSTEAVSPYTLYQAYEALGVALTRQQKLNDAANTIVEARKRLPQYAAALTEKLAVILYLGGQKQEALDQLGAMREQARAETLPESRLIFYRLGLLAAEMGRSADARAAFGEFLTLTRDVQTPEIQQARADSETRLRDLPR